MSYFVSRREEAISNQDFRRVIFTASHVQIVLIRIPAGEEIGEEVHDEHDQIFVVVAGEGKVLLGKEQVPIKGGDTIVIPVKVYHNVKSLGPSDLKLYSFCSPPHHPPGLVHTDKASAAPSQEH